MKGRTKIVVTDPTGTESLEFPTFKSCNVSNSASGRVSSFRFTVDSFDSRYIDRFPKGSDVKIYQYLEGQPEQQTMRGWLTTPGKQRNGNIKTIEFSGVDYTGRLQYIIVTESYDGQTIDVVVKDLIAKYVPWATSVNIQTSSRTIKKKFNREYLFEALEFLASIEGWEFFIDFNLDFNFFDPSTRVNSITISEASSNYSKGSAKFNEDPRLINKLYVKGGAGLSTPYSQVFKGDGVRRSWPLDYKPHNFSMTLNGVSISSIGIDNVDSTDKDYYLNYQEKLLRQNPNKVVLTSSDTLIVTYQFDYPILLLLEDKISQSKYGVFEDKLEVNSDDRDLVQMKGMQHLKKYSNPLIKGSIEPIVGYYRAGELVVLDLPSINVQTALKITQVNYDSKPGELKIALEMETDYDTRLVLKEIRNAVKRLEQQFDENAPIEQIISFIEVLTFSDYLAIRPNNGLIESLSINDTANTITQNSGTFKIGIAKVGFADVG